mgnify:CR=1 FL=1
MRRGEVWWVNLEPAHPGEADKTRPCVIVSNDANNVTAQRLGRGVVTIAPLTTSTSKVFAFQVLVPARVAGLEVDSKIQTEQVRTVAVNRLGKRIGSLQIDLRDRVDRALRLHLAL